MNLGILTRVVRPTRNLFPVAVVATLLLSYGCGDKGPTRPPGLPTATVAATDAGAGEAGPDPGTFMFSRTGSTTAALVVRYSLTGTAVGADYNPALNGSATIPAHQTSTTVTITPINDAVVEGNETVIVTLTADEAYTLGSPASATITIADNDVETPAVSVTATDASAGEAGPDPGTFTFSRTGPTAAALVVNYSVTGTAAGADYTPTLTGSATIPAGQASTTVTITPVDDSDVEAGETVIVMITAAAAYTLGSPGSATITIADNDVQPPTVTVNATDASAGEAGSDPGTFTFSRTGSTTAALVVNYSLTGTAAGADYTPTLTGSATVPVGQAVTTVTITPVVDSDVEGGETVIVTITADAAYTVGSPGSATITIADDDVPPATVTVAATDANAGEAGPDPGTFTFNRVGPTAGPLAVSYSVTGTAAGSDYTPTLTGSVTFATGQSSVDVTVTPVRDNIFESNETVVLNVVAGAGYTVGTPSTDMVTIADDPVMVTLTALDSDASESGDPGEFTFARSGGDPASSLSVTFTIGGTATNGVDCELIPAGITIPANASTATLNVAPLADNIVEAPETVILTLTAGSSYVIGTPSSGTVTIADDPAVVEVSATEPNAWETGPVAGVFTFTRTGGDPASSIQVFFTRSGTATDGVDYSNLGDDHVTIPGNESSITLTVSPILDAAVEADETVIVTISPNAGYTIGADGAAMVTIHDASAAPLVSVSAIDPTASEAGLDPGAFRFTRTGDTASAITVTYSIGGTAVNGADFVTISDSIVIEGGQASADLTITPLADVMVELTETVVIAVTDGAAYDVGSPVSASVSIVDAGSLCEPVDKTLVNGALACGEISGAGEVDTWTFTANTGDRIAVNIGEAADNNDFRPWIRILPPVGASLGSSSGVGAADLETVAPATGTYQVLVASFDSGFDGTGTYRLTMTHTPGPITVSADDQGGPLNNGEMHTGELLKGDLDVWTFTANTSDRIAVHVGQLTDNDDFRPWIRIWSPTGASLGSSSGGGAADLETVAPATGTYLVLVSSFDSGVDGAGTYRLTMTRTPGPITVTDGDQGGPLNNGAMHTGELLKGDLDVWTFTANTSDRIAVHIGEITDNDDFRPWIRIWGPTGASLGSSSGGGAADLETVAPATGTYLVLVSSFDSGVDGSGTYQLTMTHTPGPVSVTAGDQGGDLINGAMHTGEILKGDLDVWAFTANQGDRIAVLVGQITDNDDFRPWIRIWAPTGASLGSSSGGGAADLETVAPATGTYLVLVSSFDSGVDGTGTYRLTMTHTPGPITVSAGDQGGPVNIGASHAGQILQGDLDVWTVTVAAGEHIRVDIAQTADTDDFRPWIRLWAPSGASLGSNSGTETAAIGSVTATVSGTYLVLVSSFDSGVDGEGSYSLVVTKP